jgi:glycerol-3-phosphate cytidylyltransferase-like family protein
LAVLGKEENSFFKTLEWIKPDIIALGYDQELDGKMRKQIEPMGIRIVRIKSSLKGYKTRDILNSLETRKA